jgi:Flp pilus assembly protein TadG
MFWTQIGLQHGAEMAARCATINATLCPTNDPAAIASYAAQQAYGLSLPTSTFTYSTPACGNQVNASYTFVFPDILNIGSLTLKAQACFPA